eukprot:13004247-Alexandrium_andersonii.AAC.1
MKGAPSPPSPFAQSAGGGGAPSFKQALILGGKGRGKGSALSGSPFSQGKGFVPPGTSTSPFSADDPGGWQ